MREPVTSNPRGAPKPQLITEEWLIRTLDALVAASSTQFQDENRLQKWELDIIKTRSGDNVATYIVTLLGGGQIQSTGPNLRQCLLDLVASRKSSLASKLKETTELVNVINSIEV